MITEEQQRERIVRLEGELAGLKAAVTNLCDCLDEERIMPTLTAAVREMAEGRGE